MYAAIRGFVLDIVWWLSIAKLILWLVTKIEEGIIRERNARAAIVARWPVLTIKKCKLQAAMHKLWTVSLRLSSLHY